MENKSNSDNFLNIIKNKLKNQHEDEIKTNQQDGSQTMDCKQKRNAKKQTRDGAKMVKSNARTLGGKTGVDSESESHAAREGNGGEVSNQVSELSME